MGTGDFCHPGSSPATAPVDGHSDYRQDPRALIARSDPFRYMTSLRACELASLRACELASLRACELATIGRAGKLASWRVGELWSDRIDARVTKLGSRA